MKATATAKSIKKTWEAILWLVAWIIVMLGSSSQLIGGVAFSIAVGLLITGIYALIEARFEQVLAKTNGQNHARSRRGYVYYLALTILVMVIWIFFRPGGPSSASTFLLITAFLRIWYFLIFSINFNTRPSR